MSHIFDALLKSEGDRAGVDEKIQENARDVLMRAERRAAGQRRADNPDGNVISAVDEIAGTDSDASSNANTQAASVPPPLQPGHYGNLIHEVRSIDVALPSDSRVVAVVDKNCPAAEAFRLLCVRLRHFRKGRRLRSVLLTSTIPQEGKSFSAANLACTIAAVSGDKVLLVEADLRRPVQSELFGLGELPGLRGWLQGQHDLKETIYYLNGPNLWFVPAGGSIANPLDLLQSPKVSALLNQVSEWFDWIIVDSPPLLPLADTSVLSRLVDGILLVTRRGTTEKRSLQRSLDSIEKDKLLGAIINSSLQNHSNYDYYYGAPTPRSPQGDGG